MPPMRSIPPAKPVKTERTHEENQERAYIAASRRSDRSLEARVESARRASEIHKRRTGRSLRVTEQDVINEEMYEEEDDDLPMQYRRLTAHLQTSNAEFDRRLQSYLAHQMGMRAPLMANGQMDPSLAPGMQLSSRQFMNPNMMQMPQYSTQNAMQSSPVMSRGVNHRQSPYQTHPARPATNPRSASIATPQEYNNWYHHQPPSVTTPGERPKTEDRQPSISTYNVGPAHTPTSIDSQADASNANSPALAGSSSSSKLAKAHTNVNQTDSPQQQPTPPLTYHQPLRHASFAGPFSSGSMSAHDQGPLTAKLSLESQQILAADPNQFAVSGSQHDDWNLKPQQRFYSYNPNGRSRQPALFAESQGGMEQTLAPASYLPPAIDTSYHQNTLPLESAPAFSDSTVSPFGYFGADNMVEPSFDIDPFKLGSSASTSGQDTPGEADWNAFVNGGMFDDVVTS